MVTLGRDRIMLREEELIKQSDIIKYLEGRIKSKKKGLDCAIANKDLTQVALFTIVIEELEFILNHLKEVIRNAENRNK